MSDPKKKKKEKIICLKCVLEPIELKRYIQKKFLSTMKNWGLELSNFFDVPKKKIEKKMYV